MGNSRAADLAEAARGAAVDGGLAAGRRDAAAARPREERREGPLLPEEPPAMPHRESVTQPRSSPGTTSFAAVQTVAHGDLQPLSLRHVLEISAIPLSTILFGHNTEWQGEGACLPPAGPAERRREV